MPGQLIQIDTVFVMLAPGKAVKHFAAYCPVAKWTVAGVAGRATASLADSFLDKVMALMPFKVSGVQVDGGSEFIAGFDRLQPYVDAFAHRYNHHRPHDALDGKAPAEYL